MAAEKCGRGSLFHGEQEIENEEGPKDQEEPSKACLLVTCLFSRELWEYTEGDN